MTQKQERLNDEKVKITVGGSDWNGFFCAC